MLRRVKGVFFADYVRLIRANKDRDWRRFLEPEDMPFLEERIEDAEWYPFEAFERMGLALFQELSNGDLESVRLWGRLSVDELSRVHTSLVCQGNPMESLMRFQVLRTSFFDFDPVVVGTIEPTGAVLEIHYGMGVVAEQAATYQTLGYFERILELSGARVVRNKFVTSSWKGAPATRLQLDWHES